MPNCFGLSEGPKRFSGGRVHCYNLSPWRCDRVQNTVDINRRGSGEIIQIWAEIVATPDPGLLELLEIRSVNLFERRKPGVAHIAADVAPLAILSAGESLSKAARITEQYQQAKT